MPVFDFSDKPVKNEDTVCTYTAFQSNAKKKTPEEPILVLDNSERQWIHHALGVFTNPAKRTAFEFKENGKTFSADILKIDSRFVSLIKWLGENHISVRLSGKNLEDGYAVYRIRETAFGGGTKLSAADGFLQFMIERLLASTASEEVEEDDDADEEGDDMKLTSLQSISDFMTCAGRTMPDNIRLWARRNLAVARSNEVSPEERRHAQRALSIMMNIQWKSNYFEAIDPVEARRILDEELYGMVAGQTKVITITLPENSKYSDYAGKRVVFELTMSYVQQANVPMLTDAFVKSAFNCETVDSYKAHVKNDVSGTIETKITEAKNKAILTQLLDKCKVTGYPEEFLAQQSSKLEESISFYSTLQGKTNDEYCQNLYGMTFDEFVKASAGQQLVYQAIAEKECLAITDYEYKDDLEQFAKDSGYSKVDTFTDKYDKETIVKSMLVKKAQNLVMDNAVITEK